MDSELSGEQSQLCNSLQKLLAREYSFEQRQAMLRTQFGHSPPLSVTFSNV